ncbi:PTHD3-like protein [Mya arenaria]|uniref:PTHD3-like protein n=1 Tax=Mya arenaria TaxID=6604 RepID=A0ABY7DMB0_MYAAR|nr:PTHD3-like protein [Mya arenaria]
MNDKISCFHKLFDSVSTFVFENPWPIVLASFIGQTLFGLCFLSLHLNNDIKDLYLPENTQTEKTERYIVQTYSNQSELNFIPHATIKPSLQADIIFYSKNRSVPLNWSEVQDVFGRIESIETSTLYQRNARMRSVCATSNGTCVVTNTSATTNHRSMTKEERVLNTYIKMSIFLRQDTEGRHAESTQWLDKFTQTMTTLTSETTGFVFSTSLSFYDRLNSDTYIDIRYFGLVFTVFMTYCGFLLSGGDCLTKQAHIGRMGLIVTPLSVMGAWGLLTGCGVAFTNMTGVMPLVNNVQYTLMKLAGTSGIPDAKTRIQQTVRESTVSVCAATITATVPLVAGLFSSYKSTRLISLYTVVTMCFTYINHWTMFLGCLAIHEKRIDANRHCCTCRKIHLPDDDDVQDRSSCFRCCCTGRPPRSYRDTQSTLQKIPRYILTRAVLSLPCKILSTCLCFVFLGTSIVFAIKTKTDIYHESFIKEGSNFYDYNILNDKYFSDHIFITLASKHQSEITVENCESVRSDLIKYIDAKEGILSDETIFWFDEYINVVQENKSQNFASSVRNFLSMVPKFKQDIVFSEDGSKIQSFRLYLKSRPKQDNIKLHSEFGNEAFLGELVFFVYSPNFIWVDSYQKAFWETLVFMGVECLGIVVTIFFICRDPVLTVYGCIWYGFACVGIFGLINVLDVSITSVCSIVLIFGATYSCNVIVYSHLSYFESEGTDIASRTYNVLVGTTSLLFNTLFATLLGLMVMFTNESFVFVTIFKGFGSSIVVALFVGCLFIPTLLSIFGPNTGKTWSYKVEKKIDMTATANGHLAQEPGQTNNAYIGSTNHIEQV